MTQIPLDKCPACFELDNAVAIALDWTRIKGQMAWIKPDGTIVTWEPTSYGEWHPSSSIEDAWPLAKLLCMAIIEQEDIGWRAIPWNRILGGHIDTYYKLDLNDDGASGKTVELAIVRAYLAWHNITKVEVQDHVRST